MEVLGYLRDPAPKHRMDVASALRLLAAHKDTIAGERATGANVSAAEVRASIERKAPQIVRDGYTRLPPGDDPMTPFDDVAYPLALGRDAAASPEFSTGVAVTASGYEHRNALWSDARMRYDVGPGIRSEEELGTLLAFFRARYGPARGFRLRDPFDFNSHGMTDAPEATSRWWHSSKTPAGPVAPSSRSIRGRAGMPMAALSCSGRGAHEADGTGSTKSSNHWLNKASSMKSVWATPQPLTGHGQPPRRGSCSLRPRWPHSSQIFPADRYGSASRGASRPLHRCASSPYDRRSPCHCPSTSIPPPRAMDFRC